MEDSHSRMRLPLAKPITKAVKKANKRATSCLVLPKPVSPPSGGS